jgi:hypothetical protein
MRIRGVVEGNVMFPDHPDRTGGLGLVGGEDVQAQRRTFRSPTEAARWCEDVLAGTVKPRWTAYGDLLPGYTGPYWSGAFIVAETADGTTLKRWELHGNEWRQG